MQELKTLSVKIPANIDDMFAEICERAGVTRYQMLKNFVAYVIRASSGARDLTADGSRVLQSMCMRIGHKDFAIVKRGDDIVLYIVDKEYRRADDILDAILGCLIPHELSSLRTLKNLLRTDTIADTIDVCVGVALREYGGRTDNDIAELFADNDRDDFGRKMPEHRPKQTKTKRQ